MAFSRSTAGIIYDNSKFHLTNGIKMWIIIKYYRFATLAQLAEHLIRNERVVGSNPISGSKVNKRFPDFGRPLFYYGFSLGAESLKGIWLKNHLLRRWD